MMLGLAAATLGRGGVNSPPPTPINPLTLFSGANAGTAGAWYDPSDLSSMWQDSAATVIAAVNSPVGRINDKSGNGNHATQATAGMRPILKQSGSVMWLEFDGVDDYLQAALTLSTPREMSFAMRSLATPGNVHLLGGAIVGLAGTTLYLYQGASGQPSVGIATGSDFVANARLNGSSSRLNIDGGSYATGDPGTLGETALTIANSPGGGSPVNLRFYGLAATGRVMTAAEASGLTIYLGAKQGRNL